MNSPKDYLTDRVDDLLIEAIHGFEEREEYDEWVNRVKALIEQSMEVGREEAAKEILKIANEILEYPPKDLSIPPKL